MSMDQATHKLSRILSIVSELSTVPAIQKREELRIELYSLYQGLGDHLPLPNVVEAITQSGVMPRHAKDCVCDCGPSMTQEQAEEYGQLYFPDRRQGEG